MRKIWHEKDIPIEKIVEIIILALEGYSYNEIAKRVKVGKFSVWKYRKLLLEN